MVAMKGYTTISASHSTPGSRKSNEPRWLRQPPPPTGSPIVGSTSVTGAAGSGASVSVATVKTVPSPQCRRCYGRRRGMATGLIPENHCVSSEEGVHRRHHLSLMAPRARARSSAGGRFMAKVGTTGKLAVVAAGILGVATACGSSSSPASSSSSSSSSSHIGGSVSLWAEWTAQEQQDFLAALQPFEAATGITVNYQGKGSNMDTALDQRGLRVARRPTSRWCRTPEPCRASRRPARSRT